LLLYQGLGALAWPPTSVVLCMAAAFLLPLLAMASRRLRRALLWFGGSIALGGLLVTLLLPTFSTQWPERVNVEYWLDADTGHAHWWVQPASLHLPAAMMSVASFDASVHPRFKGINQMGFTADAPAVAAQAPRLEPIAVTAAHHQMRVTSPRGADKIFLLFPAEAKVGEIVLDTPAGPLPAQLLKLEDGSSLLILRNVADEGMALSIDSHGPFSVSVLDESYGLPANLSQGIALQSARPENATSSQDGDVTVLGRTVR
jgi:hypothetical protein